MPRRPGLVARHRVPVWACAYASAAALLVTVSGPGPAAGLGQTPAAGAVATVPDPATANTFGWALDTTPAAADGPRLSGLAALFQGRETADRPTTTPLLPDFAFPDGALTPGIGSLAAGLPLGMSSDTVIDLQGDYASLRALVSYSDRLLATERGIVLASGFVRPITGVQTSPYGMRFHPYLHVWGVHTGLDLASPCGTPVRAVADGVVSSAGWNTTGYGNRVVIAHSNVLGKKLDTSYNHLAAFTVEPGDTVRQGQVVGLEGTTGFSTGCHLHFEVIVDGQKIDPAPFLGLAPSASPTLPAQRPARDANPGALALNAAKVTNPAPATPSQTPTAPSPAPTTPLPATTGPTTSPGPSPTTGGPSPDPSSSPTGTPVPTSTASASPPSPTGTSTSSTTPSATPSSGTTTGCPVEPGATPTPTPTTTTTPVDPGATPTPSCPGPVATTSTTTATGTP